MAAPWKSFIFRRFPYLFFKYSARKQLTASTVKYTFSVPFLEPVKVDQTSQKSIFSLWKNCFFRPATPPVSDSVLSITSSSNDNKPDYIGNKANRRHCHGGSSQNIPQGDRNKQRLRLMDFPEIIWPHPFKTLRNFFFVFLIRGYFDHHFATQSFLEGAEQAVLYVSSLVSQGKFDDLEGLVSREALREIRHNYQELSANQRNFLVVNPKDLFFRFIYEIGMIFDDDTDQRYVEITTAFHGMHGLEAVRERQESIPVQDLQTEMQEAQSKVFVCNYRFIREYTKGKEDNEWTINKLNHFSPREIVSRTNMFSR